MNESQDDLDALRSTGAEADRFLKSLEADQVRDQLSPVENKQVPQKPVPAEPVVSPQHPSSQRAEQEQGNPGIGLLIIAIFITPLLLVWLFQTSSQEPVSSTPPLRYSKSCGSPPGAGKRWWPVLGRPNRQLLQTIRNRYCGDAYINEEGSLQVASFDSRNGAESFRLRLEAATGSSFRVGQGRY